MAKYHQYFSEDVTCHRDILAAQINITESSRKKILPLYLKSSKIWKMWSRY